jgi:hypothetical protein
MRRKVAVSNGTFLEEGVGGASAATSMVLFRCCNASMTDRALASESFRGRVIIGLEPEDFLGVSYFDFGGIGEDWGPKMA